MIYFYRCASGAMGPKENQLNMKINEHVANSTQHISAYIDQSGRPIRAPGLEHIMKWSVQLQQATFHRIHLRRSVIALQFTLCIVFAYFTNSNTTCEHTLSHLSLFKLFHLLRSFRQSHYVIYFRHFT